MVMMTNMVRNLIFDVGNVLIGYRWFEMLTEDFGLSSEEAIPWAVFTATVSGEAKLPSPV